MAGLNLSEAVGNYQRGVQFRQQQEVAEAKLGEMRRQQAIQRDAAAAFNSVIEPSKAQWAASNPQGPYQPNDETMLAASAAVSQVYLKHGDLDGFAANEAKVQAHRTRLRHNALKQFAVDGDVMTLVKRTVPTLVPGMTVQGVELMGGSEQGPATKAAPGAAPDGASPGPLPAPPDAAAGAIATGDPAEAAAPAQPAGPGPLPKPDAPARSIGADRIRVMLSGGKSKDFEIDKFVQMLKVADLDPAAAAKEEFEFRMKAALEDLKARKTMDVEEHRTGRALALETAKAGHAQELRAAQDKAAGERNERSARATENAAATSAAGRVKAAQISADKPSKSGGGVKDDLDELKLQENVHTAVASYLSPERMNTLMGAGARLRNQDTANIRDMVMAARRQQVDSGQTPTPFNELIAGAAAEYFKRQKQSKPGAK